MAKLIEPIGEVKGQYLLDCVKLKRVRTEKGLTQEKMARLAGLSSNYVNQLEKDDRNVSVDTLFRLSEVLKVNHTRLVSLVVEGE